MTANDANLGPGTRCVHAGVDRARPLHSIPTPIVRSAPFTFANSADLDAFMFAKVWGGGETGGREEYSRDGGLTIHAVERRLAALEGGGDAALFASGMSALTTLLLAHVGAGDHLILTDDCYRHSFEFCMTMLKRLGVETEIVPLGDYDALAAALRPQTRFIISESPTNPFLRLVDFERLATLARAAGVATIIDSTFGTPLNQQPLACGIDYVIHSATKYLGGHHDLLAGVVIAAPEHIARLRAARTILGGLPAPETAFLIERGLKTLALRMARHNANGLAVARYLADQPKVARVWYPGLESHPDHALAVRQMQGFGGVVSFEVAGDDGAANRLIDALRIPLIAPSLGGVESLIGSPAVMAYYDLEPEERARFGMTDNLLRFALGIEDADDLIADLEQAFAQV